MKTKNTNPEIKIRSILFSKGYRFKVHDKKLPGKPDIVLPKHKVVINVNGCFWHYHGCGKCNIPKSKNDKIIKGRWDIYQTLFSHATQVLPSSYYFDE